MKEQCTLTRLLGQCTLGNGHNQKESYQFILNIQNPRTRKSLSNQYWNQHWMHTCNHLHSDKILRSECCNPAVQCSSPSTRDCNQDQQCRKHWTNDHDLQLPIRCQLSCVLRECANAPQCPVGGKCTAGAFPHQCQPRPQWRGHESVLVMPRREALVNDVKNNDGQHRL